jgi:DNA/RNA-binding domain of Phe-tRNA-synthetase-like protein
MEASQKPQLPLQQSDEATVRAIDGRLVIEHLEVADERAAQVVRERAEAGTPPAETVGKSIEIGTRVLDSEETAANVDYVRRELEAGLGELDRKLGGKLDEGAEALAERIAAAFGAERNDSVQAQIREIVTAESRTHREELVRTLTAEDGSNPLVAIQARLGKAMLEAEERHRSEVERLRESHSKEARAMQGQVGELRKELARVLERQDADERVAEAEAAGTRKGRSFEERVHAALERIADARGDCARHVGDERGEGGSKKGDTVVEIGAQHGPTRGRIVFEDKDEKLSRNDAWKELNAAMVERDADFAVLVVAGEENIPAKREQLIEYEGNKMIVAVDPDFPDELGLDLVYRYARLRLLTTKDGSLQVDAAGVRDAAETARSALKRVQPVRLALTNIDKSSSKAREGVDALVKDVEGELARIETLVAAAAEESEPAPEG